MSEILRIVESKMRHFSKFSPHGYGDRKMSQARRDNVVRGVVLMARALLNGDFPALKELDKMEDEYTQKVYRLDMELKKEKGLK